MNVFKCARGQLWGNDMHCVYKMLRMNNNSGDLEDEGCMRCGGGQGHDDYNLYPEFRSDGSWVIQASNPIEPKCFRLGPTLFWENITGQHQDGLNFDFRDFPADIHPEYHREERNLPATDTLHENGIGEIFGETELMLVVPGWNIEKFYKTERIDECKNAIYGRYDESTDMVLPNCLKSYTRDIPGWVDYSGRGEWFTPRAFFVDNSTDGAIIAFCHNHFTDSTVSDRMSEAMMDIRTGAYIDTWTLMNNNFVSDSEKRSFMEKVSLRTKAGIYKGNINLQNYCDLYTYLGKAEWLTTYVNEDGKQVKIVKKIPREICKLFKQNLMNWILNNPALEDIPNEREWYPTKQRYWYVAEMLRKAMKEKVLDRTVKLPRWLIKQFSNSRNDRKLFSLFGESYEYDTAPKDVQEEFADAQLLRLGNEPQRMYPGMVRVKSIIEVKENSPMWFSFCDILKAGQKWNISEIQTAWDYFKRAWAFEEAKIFWDWVEEMEMHPYESQFSLSEEEFRHQLDKVDGIALETPSPFIEMTDVGAADLNLGQGEITVKRFFAANLMECKKEDDSFDVQQRTVTDTYDGRARVKSRRECNHETFWNELIKMGGLKGDREKLNTSLSKEMHEELLANREEGEVSTDSTLEHGFDTSDLASMSSFDIYSGDYSHFNSGGGSWQEEE